MPKYLNIVRFLLFLSLVVVSFYGIGLPDGHINEIKIKQFSLQAYEYGITINNDNEIFYNIAPVNFYFDTPQGKAEVLPEINTIVSQESNVKNKFIRISQSLKSSLGTNTITATFKNGDELFTLTGNILGNSLRVNNKTTSKMSNLVQTITYSNEDIIFDEKMQVLTTQTQEQIDEINDLYNLNFKSGDPAQNQSYKKMYITNLKNPGVVEIDLNNATGTLDTNNFLIEIRGNYELVLRFYNSLEDVGSF